LEEGRRGEEGAGNVPKDNGGPGSLLLGGDGVRAGSSSPIPPTGGSEDVKDINLRRL